MKFKEFNLAIDLILNLLEATTKWIVDHMDKYIKICYCITMTVYIMASYKFQDGCSILRPHDTKQFDGVMTKKERYRKKNSEIRR